jgi:hemerythrin superfamily protein
MSGSAKATIDHEAIRAWVEERGGKPAHVASTGDEEDPGILRIDFPGFSGEGTLEPISWSEWFDAFEENRLAFLYSDDVNSRFNKLVSRESVAVQSVERIARSKRTPNAIDMLTRDHEKVRGLFARLDDDQLSTSQIETLFDELRISLQAHTRAEEEVFYPAVEAGSATLKKLIRQAHDEHHEVDELLAELIKISADDENFIERLQELHDAVELHAEKEESKMFPEAEKVLDEADLERLAEDMKAIQDEIIARNGLTIEDQPSA